MTEALYQTEDHFLVVKEGRVIRSAKDLIVYQKGYALALEIFGVTKAFPPEERYSLTSQLRRASRSVCGNLREAWAKRRYEAHFISKLTDVDGENGEVQTWLDFARDHNYITASQHEALLSNNREVGKMIGAMINNPEPFLLNTTR